jgi:hypothetical protein
VRHDSTREIDAAVREATAPLREEIERQKRYVQMYLSACDAHVAFRKTLDATIMELRDHLSRAHASLAEMTRCTTAGQLQEAKERQRGTTYPWHLNDPRKMCSGASRGTFGREDLAT